VISAPFAKLATAATADAVKEAGDYLNAQAQAGVLSIYQCDAQAELELVAIARSLGCMSECSFRFTEIFDSDLQAVGLTAKHTPGSGVLKIPAANLLHYSLQLPTIKDAESLVLQLRNTWDASRKSNQTTRPTIEDSIPMAKLKKMAQTDNRFSPFIPPGHWLLKKKK